MALKSLRFLVIWVAAVTVLADQSTKFLVAFLYDLGPQQYSVLDGCFSIVHWRNTGAAWGLFTEHPFLLAVISLFVLGFLFLFAEQITENSRLQTFALGLIVGGIVGNLIDRIWHGAVTDFLLFYYRSFTWPAFNIADSAITVGVAIYVFAALFARPSQLTKTGGG